MYGREANTHDESLCGGGGAVVEVGVVCMDRGHDESLRGWGCC